MFHYSLVAHVFSTYTTQLACIYSCFVHCVLISCQVRAGSLQELVYKSGQAGVTKATVTITFDNRDKKQSPVGYESYDELTVSRQVQIPYTK